MLKKKSDLIKPVIYNMSGLIVCSLKKIIFSYKNHTKSFHHIFYKLYTFPHV